MKARLYSPQDERLWESLVAECTNGTLLHARRFLDYHASRFLERSLIIESDDEVPIGILPAVSMPEAPQVTDSHGGATFGGLLVKGHANLVHHQAALDAAIETWSALGVRRLNYSPTPGFIAAQPNQIDVNLMLARGAEVIGADLTSVLHLDRNWQINKGRKWGVRRARDNQLAVKPDCSIEAYRTFHAMLCDTLRDRHDSAPTHTLDELLDLRERLTQDALLFVILTADGEMVAGSWVLRYTPTIWHTQYIAASGAGRDLKANDLLLEHIIEQGRQSGARTLSLGTSVAHQSGETDPGLFAFKSHFGAGAELLWHLTLDFDKIKP